MPCIHGLDEMSCPTCRTMNSQIPENQIKLNKRNLKPESQFNKFYLNKKDKFLNDLIPNKVQSTSTFINIIPKPNLVNEIPNFENKMFKDRLKEIDISKSDLLGISKKIPLESPEWKFEEED